MNSPGVLALLLALIGLSVVAVTAACLAGLVALVAQLRHDRRALALLLLLPSSWLYTHDRYDALPALMTVASLFALAHRRNRTAWALLALACATEWYPLVMAPAYFAYQWQTDRRVLFGALASFGGLLLAVLLTASLAIGWEHVLELDSFQLDRGVHRESLLWLVTRAGPLAGAEDSWLAPLFLLGQFALAPLPLLARVDNWRRVAAWSAIAVLGFMLCAKSSSPQGILWVSPYLIVLARTRKEIAGIVLLDVVTYAYNPLAFFGGVRLDSLEWGVLFALKTAVLIGWLLHLLRMPMPRGDDPYESPTDW